MKGFEIPVYLVRWYVGATVVGVAVVVIMVVSVAVDGIIVGGDTDDGCRVSETLGDAVCNGMLTISNVTVDERYWRCFLLSY
jgi:hypothetical protein